MAASAIFTKKSITFCRFALLRRAVLTNSCSFSNTASDIQDTDEEERIPKVGMSADGRTLICWHPESTHPYEYTQPVTYEAMEAKEGEAPILRRIIRQHETRFRKDGPSIPELSKITYTTKHQWFPNNKEKYRSKHYDIEREGL